MFMFMLGFSYSYSTYSIHYTTGFLMFFYFDPLLIIKSIIVKKKAGIDLPPYIRCY